MTQTNSASNGKVAGGGQSVALWEQDEGVLKSSKILRWMAWAGLGLLAFVVVVPFFEIWFRRGFGSALFNAIVSLLIFGLLFVIYARFVVGGVARVLYSKNRKAMVAALPALGVQPQLLQSWSLPTPGVLALDTQHRQVYIQSAGTGQQRIVLRPEQILGVKVERETEMHTTTKHGGSVGVFSGNFGYNFGSTSKSKTTVIENAFLELHFQLNEHDAPDWVAVPYGANRRDADAMAAAIQRLQ